LLASHSNPSKESLKNEERGVRELSFGFGRSSARRNGKRERERTEGGEGVFIPLDPKIAVRRTVTRRLRVYARRLRATLTFRPENSTRTLRAKGSGVSGPVPGVSGLGRMKTHVLLF